MSGLLTLRRFSGLRKKWPKGLFRNWRFLYRIIKGLQSDKNLCKKHSLQRSSQ
jgi:hypothetical protein